MAVVIDKNSKIIITFWISLGPILVDFGFADQDLAALKPDSLITAFDQLPPALEKVGL